MKKNIVIVVLAIIVLAGAYAVYYFEFRKPKIMDTPNIVENIRKIGQFTSMHYFASTVVAEKKDDSFSKSYLGKMINSSSKDEIVIIAKGVANAGFDLQKVSEKDIVVSGDTISIVLPSVEVFEVIINPSDVEVFQERGKWSHDQISTISAKAKDNILKEAEDKGLLKKASDSGVTELKEIFKMLGFAVVNITVAS